MLPDCTPSVTPERQELARTFLSLANTEFQRHRQHRGYYAKLARQYGLTHQEIADSYGITEAAVRALIQRAA